MVLTQKKQLFSTFLKFFGFDKTVFRCSYLEIHLFSALYIYISIYFYFYISIYFYTSCSGLQSLFPLTFRVFYPSSSTPFPSFGRTYCRCVLLTPKRKLGFFYIEIHGEKNQMNHFSHVRPVSIPSPSCVLWSARYQKDFNGRNFISEEFWIRCEWRELSRILMLPVSIIVHRFERSCANFEDV